MKDILFEFQDINYREFCCSLIPTIKKNTVIGVRTPILRSLAKQIAFSYEAYIFMNSLPHQYYEENNLHAFLIAAEKDYTKAIVLTESFLPYINNWSTCDSFNPISFKNNTDKLYYKIKQWIKSDKTYTVRFGIEMLMKHYLEDNFKDEIPEIILGIKSEEYYVKMMIAWYFATALAKRYDDIIVYIEKGLPDMNCPNLCGQHKKGLYGS